jgi:hypothetical protein
VGTHLHQENRDRPTLNKCGIYATKVENLLEVNVDRFGLFFSKLGTIFLTDFLTLSKIGKNKMNIILDWFVGLLVVVAFFVLQCSLQ